MRFSVGLVAALVASAHALPRGGSIFRPRQESGNSTTYPIHQVDDGDDEEEEDPDTPLDPTDTCPADGKSQESWQEQGIGEWLIIMANVQEEYTEDIQKTIQSWGYSQGLYSFHCEPMQHCDGNFETDECMENQGTARVYFINYAISNFNNWMTSLSEAVDRTAGIADGMAASLVDTFSSTPDDLTIPSFPGVLTAGILGIIGALLTGPAAGAVAIGGALATTAVGVIGMINDGNSIELEPKFNDFADVTKYLAEASSTLQTALGDYARWALTSIPTQDIENGIRYIEDESSLVRVLEDGTFAEPVATEQLPDNIYVSLFSGAITELWNKEQAIVAKFPSDEPTLDSPPCETEGIFDGMTWCDDDGNLYALLKYPELGSWLPAPMTDETKDIFKGLPGVDKLGDYKMSVETVVKASENAYRVNGDEAYMDWNPESTMDFMLEDSNNMIEFVTFNFPFCDLGDYGWNGSPDNVGIIENDDCDAECQLIYRLTNGCSLYYPWDHTETVYWEDSCDFIPGNCEDFCMPGGFVGSC